MNIALKTVASIAAAASLSACIDMDDVDIDTSPADRPFNQTINFERGVGGSGTIVQSVQSGAGSAGKARICFINNGPFEATLLHQQPGINPLRAAPGGQSCANFQSSARVNFTLVERNGFVPIPASPDRAFVYSLAPFDGDIVQLRWQAQ